MSRAKISSNSRKMALKQQTTKHDAEQQRQSADAAEAAAAKSAKSESAGSQSATTAGAGAGAGSANDKPYLESKDDIFFGTPK